QLIKDYEKTKRQHWNGYNGYDRWFAQDLNNAKLAALNSYTYYAAAFTQMFADAGNDFATFYINVRKLSELPKQEREQRLQALSRQADIQSAANQRRLALRKLL
ncbi:MAG: aminopeptidase, partial [Phycisphaerae bacterium]|nr:aminopeptidase [Phycisphaerae bacterium]